MLCGHSFESTIWLSVNRTRQINNRIIIQDNKWFIYTNSLSIRERVKKLHKQDSYQGESVFFFAQNVPPCLSRKPKRAESEIPSLPEAGPAALSFEKQHGKINGHLLREPLGHAVLLPHGQTSLGPVVCCCRCCFWVSQCCLLWEDFQPCATIKISVFSFFVCPPLSQPYYLF